MDDSISRQQTLDALDTAIEHYDGIAEECRKKADIERNDYMDMRDDAYEARQLAQWLNELKYLREKIEQLTIKPEQQWIPVSERVPEDYVDVLVWFEYFRYGDYNCMYATHGIGNYSKEYNSWTINHETGWKDLHVFAWMPLPEPYRKGANT